MDSIRQYWKRVVASLIVILISIYIQSQWNDKQLVQGLSVFIAAHLPLLIALVLVVLILRAPKNKKLSGQIKKVFREEYTPGRTWKNKIRIIIQFNQCCHINGTWETENTDLTAPPSLVWSLKTKNRDEWTSGDLIHVGVQKNGLVSTYINMPNHLDEEKARMYFENLLCKRPFGTIVVRREDCKERIEIPV